MAKIVPGMCMESIPGNSYILKGKHMTKQFRDRIIKFIIRVLIVTLLAYMMDYLIVLLSKDDSIWLGESIEVVGAIIWGPLVGGLATLINCIVSDYLVYQSFDFIFVDVLEALAIAAIGLIYRRLNTDEDRFTVREIAVFNFVQVLVNIVVLYLSTAPVALLFFGFVIEDWTSAELAEEMGHLADNAFSASVSVALIGTFLLGICTVFRKKYKEQQSVSGALKSIFKPTFLKNEYRSRAVEYMIGIIMAIALTMVDGVVSGQILGQDALAATSLMFPLVSFSSFMSTIFTYGCANLCATAKGQGDYERSGRLFSLGLLVTLFMGLFQSALFWCIRGLYFGYFTSSQTIETLAMEYYRFFIFVPPFMALSVFFDEAVSSDGDDILPLAGYIVSFFVNVGASIVLSKRMGMSGLALGTLLSYICYILLVLIHFLKKSNTYRFRFWFSVKDLFRFAEHSLKNNTAGLCMSVTSAAFTKAILMFWGAEYLIANTILCAMLEIYEMVNGPSEAAGYLVATYSGEKNSEGIRTLFDEALLACLLCGISIALFLLLMPHSVLLLYGIEDTHFHDELIKCIRYCSVGVIAASVGGFLGDYFGDRGKPLWSCIMVTFRTSLFPILFCVNFCLAGGIVAMGKGMLLSQIVAISIFYGFVFIIKGAENVPYMLDDPDFEKVKMNSFDYTPEEYLRISDWIHDILASRGIEEKKIAEIKDIVLSLFKKTEEKNGKHKVLGECVIRFLEEPEIIIKDNGTLSPPDTEDARVSYNVLYSSNCSTIRIS